jgi:hypothetical protein
MRIHLRIAASLFLTAGLLLVLVAASSPWLFDRFAAGVAASSDEAAQLGAAAVGLTGRFLAIGAAALTLPVAATGWGLLAHRRWARLTGIVFSAILVVLFPFGTLVGAYLLWVLLSARSEAWFEVIPRGRRHRARAPAGASGTSGRRRP